MISAAFILAAGFGNRMRPWTDLYPKPMLTLGKTPLILWHFENLFQSGVRHFLVNTHHLSHKLQGFLEFHFESFKERGARMTIFEEEEILGTGGALFHAKTEILDEHFFLVNSDIIHRIDFRQVAAFHQTKTPLATLVLKRTDDPSWKQVALREDGQVSRLGKRALIPGLGEPRFGFTGIHVLSRKIFSYCPEKKYQCIVNDIYPQAAKMGEKILGFETGAYWKDLGSLEQFGEAQRDFLNGKI